MSGNELVPIGKEGQKVRVLIAAGQFVLAIIPILLTPFPSSTDLPQHIAQVRLFLDTLLTPA